MLLLYLWATGGEQTLQTLQTLHPSTRVTLHARPPCPPKEAVPKGTTHDESHVPSTEIAPRLARHASNVRMPRELVPRWSARTRAVAYAVSRRTVWGIPRPGGVV